MYKQLSIIVLFLSGIVLMYACDNSVGNQDLREINKVEIGGIDAAYTALLNEPLVIEPELNFTQDGEADTSRYEFEWFGVRQDFVQPADQREDLATTKNLDVTVTIPPGPYEVYYRVTDKETGVQWSTKFNMEVVSSIYEGWMLMTEVNGEAQLGMVSFIADSAQRIPDVLEYANSSLELKGTPVDITTYQYDYSTYGIYVTSEGSGTTRIHPETFAWQPIYYLSYEMQDNVPEDFGADFIQPNGNAIGYLYADGDLYYSNRGFGYSYGVTINKVSDESDTFEVAPYIGAGNGVYNGYSTILYDATNQRFIQHGFGNNSSVSLMPEGTLFDYNTGKDLVYMTVNTYNGGQAFAILEDNGGTRYLARIAVGSSVTQTYYEEMSGTDIEQAEHFAISPTYGYIFYNVGSKVFQYDMSAKDSKLMLDKGAEDITYLGFVYAGFGASDLNNSLVIASNDLSAPPESSGTLELYNVPAVRQQITLEESYAGFGKIVDVDYRTR